MLPIPINPHWQYLLIWLGITSMIDFVMIGVDKDHAMYGGWRMPEKRMLSIAFIGGWAGLTAGMFVFHNKTEKITFIPVVFGIDGLWLYLLNHVTMMFGPPLAAPAASIGAYLAHASILAWALAP